MNQTSDHNLYNASKSDIQRSRISNKFKNNLKSINKLKISNKSVSEDANQSEDNKTQKKYFLELVNLDGKKFIFNIAENTLFNIGDQTFSKFPDFKDHMNQNLIKSELATKESKIKDFCEQISN